MITFLRGLMRLWLGAALLATAAGILLWSDLPAGGQRRAAGDSDTGFRRPLDRPWRLSLLRFADMTAAEEGEAGILDGLDEAGLVEGRDYELTIVSAQGSIATLTSMVTGAVNDCDMILTQSTPCLQMTIKQTGTLPVVFSLVASPIVAGAGTSYDEHRPNVTGVTELSDYRGLLVLLQQCLPDAERIGTLFNPAEANSEFHRESLAAAAEQLGLELVAVPASSSGEMSTAAVSLCNQDIDAVCQIGGNLTGGSFTSLVWAANREELPIFGFEAGQADDGAVVALARDFHDGGREAALVAARIIRGESPANIPFQAVSKTQLIINLEAAEQAGMVIPKQLLEQADRVIERESN